MCTDNQYQRRVDALREALIKISFGEAEDFAEAKRIASRALTKDATAKGKGRYYTVTQDTAVELMVAMNRFAGHDRIKANLDLIFSNKNNTMEDAAKSLISIIKQHIEMGR